MCCSTISHLVLAVNASELDEVLMLIPQVSTPKFAVRRNPLDPKKFYFTTM